MRGFFAVIACLCMAACSPKPKTLSPQFHADVNPQTVSEWGVVNASGNQLMLGEDVIVYDLNTPLFSDYSHKLRTVWMPGGVSANYHETETFDFPVGTIISKTFYYPRLLGGGPNDMLDQELALSDTLNLTTVRLIETRILVRRDHGWDALPYVWNADQTEARLKRVGAVLPLTLTSEGDKQAFNYIVPNQNQCAGCHASNATTREINPIGPKARHLNKDGQLAAWAAAGYLTGIQEMNAVPQAADWQNTDASLDSRARAYLDINCAHCHNVKGPADTSGLHYEPATQMGSHLGRCKTPVAAGGGTGDRPYDLVPGAPDESIMVYRMDSIDPGQMMPELGRSLTHTEGVKLIEDWIAAMDGGCAG